ncbi:MAG: ABC transporter ATP-binding protein [Bowdeniella nasicola]|nr:ABC transporter ATP-binding protein [Bowdeniella nasicola]
MVSSPDTPAVIARQVSVSYPAGQNARPALDRVSLTVRPGQFLAVMGPSGAGKTTLANVLSALQVPTSGSVQIGGVALEEASEAERTRFRRDRLGFVFQSENLVPSFSVRRNITLPLDLANRAVDEDQLGGIIAALDLAGHLDTQCGEATGGLAQRIALARSLLTVPDVILADEPTGDLGSRPSAEVLSLLRLATREYGRALIIFTHDPIAASYADDVVLLSDGQVLGNVSQPTYASVLSAMETLHTLTSAVV